MTHHIVDVRDPEQLRPYFGLAQQLVVDPPWKYNDQKKERKDTKEPTRGIGACHHYRGMTTAEICTLEIPKVAAPRCHLYLWATMPMLPDALQVMTAWGFTYCTVAFAWVKTNRKSLTPFFGPGFFTGSNIELVLLGRKGKPFKHTPGRKASQIVLASRREHSRKPEEIQDRIEYMYGREGLVEVFGRRDRLGWIVIGNENIFPQEDNRYVL